MRTLSLLRFHALLSDMGSHPSATVRVTDLLLNMVSKAAAQDQVSRHACLGVRDHQYAAHAGMCEDMSLYLAVCRSARACISPDCTVAACVSEGSESWLPE